jgi:glycosyltransferase involved in cell wall biosynthesis
MRVLVLSTWFPHPPSQGGKIRAYQLVRALADRHDVALVSFTDTTIKPADLAHMERLCSRVELVARSPFARSRVRTVLGWLSAQPSGVVGGYSRHMAATVQTVARDWRPNRVVALTFVTAPYALDLPNVPKILDVDNYMTRLLYEEYRRARGTAGRLRRWLSWWKFRGYERDLLRQFDVCLSVAPRDHRAIAAAMAGSSGHAALVPNGVDPAHHRPGLATPEPNTLVFNGALSYRANYDAVDYFVTEVLPLVQREVPSVCLRITGAEAGTLPNGLAGNPRVVLTGHLEDIRPVVAGSWVCVVPLRIGGGTRLKILEAMALGTPVVSTTKGAEGLRVVSGEHLLLADTSRSFAEQTVRLLRQPELRADLAMRARRLVEREYDWADIGQHFRDLVEELAGPPSVERHALSGGAWA